MFYRVLLLLVLVFSHPTMAAKTQGTATFNVESSDADQGTMTLEFLDRHTSRMSFNSQGAQQGYVLIRDNDAWLVSKAEGQTFAMNLAKTREAARALGADTNQMQNEAFGNRVHSMKRTGDTETIAQRQGDVYQIVIEEDGKKRKDTLVLTDDPEVVAYTRAWMAAFETMRKATAPDYRPHKKDLMRRLEDEDRGILRMGQDFRLASFSSKRPREARFEVPASTFDPSILSGLLGGGASSKNTTSSSTNTAVDTAADATADGAAGAEPAEKKSPWSRIGAVFSSEGKEQADRKEADAANEVKRAKKRAVDDTVDSAVDKVLDSIFN